MHCTHCGFKNPEKNVFCTSCNTRLVEESYLGYSPDPSAKRAPVAIDYTRFSTSLDHGVGTIKQRSYWNYISLSLITAILAIIFMVIVLFEADKVNFEFIEQRNFWFLSIISLTILGLTGGLIMLVYSYHNFNDFKKMMHKYHPSVYTGYQDPLLMLGVFILFSPVFIWFKYQQFREHLIYHHNTRENAPWSPIKIFGVSLIPFVSFFVFFIVIAFLGLDIFVTFIVASIIATLGSIITGFLYLYIENDWQVKFNQHIQFHEQILKG